MVHRRATGGRRRRDSRTYVKLAAARPLKRSLYDFEFEFGSDIENRVRAKRRRISEVDPKLYLYVFGGDDLPPKKGTVERYNIHQNKWERINELMPISGFGSSISVLKGHVWLTGGHDLRHNSYNTVHIYDPVGESWRKGPPLIEKRAFSGLAELDEKLYAVGGQNGLEVVDSTEVYGEVDGWHEGVPMINPRSRFGMAAMNKKLFVVGGDDGDLPLNSVECFTLSTGQWTMVKSMENGRIECGIAHVDRLLYVVGGDLNKSVAFYDEVVPSLNYWNVVSHLCARRARNNVSVVAVRKSLIMVGGHFAFSRSRKVDCFDTMTGAWTALPSMSTGRTGARLALLTL